MPNFILLLVPSTLEPSSLNTMIAFATGGLLGDVFLHLVPHAFFGDGDGVHDRSIQVEEKRNIVIGCVKLITTLADIAKRRDLPRLRGVLRPRQDYAGPQRFSRSGLPIHVTPSLAWTLSRCV